MHQISPALRLSIVTAIVKMEESDAAFAALRERVKRERIKREAFAAMAQEACSVRYNAPLKAQGTGRIVFDSAFKKPAAVARSAMARLIRECYPASQSTQPSKVRLSAEAKALAARTAAAVIKAEMTQAQFNAFIAALKAGVSFK